MEIESGISVLATLLDHDIYIYIYVDVAFPLCLFNIIVSIDKLMLISQLGEFDKG